jgi:GT2 family glycosyltransferase
VLPSLSIVIPTHNRSDLLRACLQSIQRHAPAEVEVIVVDDASPASSASSVVAEFPTFRSIRLPRQGGFAVAFNAGLRLARGEIVEVLNDDTEVTASWAEAALAGFQDPRVGAVAPLVLVHPKSPISSTGAGWQLDSAGDRYYAGGVAAKRWHGKWMSEVRLEPCQVFGASGSSAFYRRSILETIGGFPESFGAYFEDVDVAFQLNWKGWQTIFLPDSRVLHHVSSTYQKSCRRLIEMQSRNEERLFWRNTPSSALWRVLPCHVAVLTAKALRRWNEGTLTPFLLGRLRLLAELGELRRYRWQLRTAHPTVDWGSWRVEAEYWHS